MADGLHFDISANSEKFDAAVKACYDSLDELAAKAERAISKAEKIYEEFGTITEDNLKDIFSEFESFGKEDIGLDNLAGDLKELVSSNEDIDILIDLFGALSQRFKDMLAEMPKVGAMQSVLYDAFMGEMDNAVEELHRLKQASEEVAGVKFSFGNNNADILSQEEIDKLEAERNAMIDAAAAAKGYKEAKDELRGVGGGRC